MAPYVMMLMLPTFSGQISRLLWLQFDDTVSGRVLTHLRPARTIRDAQLSSLLQRFPILQSIDVSGCTRLTGAWLRDIEHHSTIK